VRRVTLVAVLRSGGDFDADHAWTLFNSAWNAGNDHLIDRVILLTDTIWHGHISTASIEPLRYDWPGWWSKFEAFGVPGPVLFLDLDSVITGDLTPLVDRICSLDAGELLMLSDFYRRGTPASGVMGWSGNVSNILRKFVKLAERSRFGRMGRLEHVSGTFRGDQNLIPVLAAPRFQVRLIEPTQHGVISYKAHVLKKRHPVEGSSVVCFHGQPRPWGVLPRPDWIVRAWHNPNRQEEA